MFFGERAKLLDVFRQTRAAKAGSCVKKLGTDSRIQSNARHDVRNVNSGNRLADVGYLIGIGYLRCEKRIACVFHHFSRFKPHFQQRDRVRIEPGKQVFKTGARCSVEFANDEPVGMQRILNRRALP